MRAAGTTFDDVSEQAAESNDDSDADLRVAPYIGPVRNERPQFEAISESTSQPS
jgi:hypothetical protein